ncbi:carbon-nitrogen hydrolase family protein [Pseudohalocynthiibacter aestuariivivens]|jgi:deaminated glutathione amidase|uniref:Carbon-nitrogen hydrolase family protein n=1 Tax=Pseudohalocynthiibacter aestuariivivens TaxID=1591409 RepID=A0ABV5JJW5_9RHOB|nr:MULTISPECIES: carbon-nitrogen hydrolase family protein [Pseudohalocynthiibacter]MBS9717620.1 carbon-nitrogen hydrolase family protein [Pseudohalocynthiibacter aestuariivivens]MCK0102818.1 carbon-nitrogen hydrolase family protein [Pseudohalocynthiibacter sp. F2068]
MRVALLQLNAGDLPEKNLDVTLDYLRQSAAEGAKFALTPEVTNCVSNSRNHQQSVLQTEADDLTLAAIRAEAKTLGIWVLIGSLGLKTNDPDGRFANRSFLIGPAGQIVARYDKIHMFDVDIDETETFRESAGYRPGSNAVVAKTDFAKIGMTICYDVRFAHLHRALAKAGAKILTSPAAFSPVSGAAHWHALLRARAIETGCFVLAPAQCGIHPITVGAPRKTYGHSLAVSPWGEILADGGENPGVTIVDFDLDDVDKCRKKIPSLTHDRDFKGP